MEFEGADAVYGTLLPYTNDSVPTFWQNGTNTTVNISSSPDSTPPYDLEGNLGPKREALGTAITMTVVYVILLLTGFVGNICTCIVIARNRYMHTATNYYLFSLAISDLLLLVLGLPQDLHILWDRYPYVFGEVFCVLRGWTSETSTNASILTITAFTVERYLAICHPLKAHTMSRLSRAIKLIVVIWICAGLSAITMAYQLGIVYQIDSRNNMTVPETAQCNIKRTIDHAFEIYTSLFFLFPASLLLVLYVLIAIQLRRSTEVGGKHNGKAETPPVNGVKEQRTKRLSSVFSRQPSKGRRKSSSSSRKDVVKMLVAVVVAFFLCWAPYHAQRLMAVYVTDPTETDHRAYLILTNISGITYYVNATINPILYSILSRKFRHAFRDTLARCLGREQPGSQRGRAASHFTSTRRSVGYEITDFTLVSESPQNADVNGQQRQQSIKEHVRHSNTHRGRFDRGRRSEDDNEDGAPSRKKKTSSSISNCSLQLVDEDAFNSRDIAEYIDQMREERS